MDPNSTNPTPTPPEGTAPTPTPEVTSAPAADTPVSSPEATTPSTDAAPAPAFGATPEATGAPAAPEAAPASVFSAAGTAGGPTPSKKNNKVILIAAIAGGAILLAIIGVVAYMLLNSVSKEDYRDATRQFNKVSIASSSLTSDASSLGYASSSDSDVTFEESVKDAEQSIADLQKENEELGKMKAVRVGEGGKLYNTFNDKLKAYVSYGEGLITSVKNLRPALVTCNKVGGADEANTRVAALKACSSELKGVSDVPNEQMKAYIDSIATAYESYASIYEQISALSNPYGAQYEQYKTLRDQMYDVQDTISEASKKFRADLEARDDELSVKDSAEALGDYLTEQQK